MFEMTEMSLWGVRVLEPVTSLTDLLTATVSFVAFASLRRLRVAGDGPRWFERYFLLVGIATTAAGLIGHAFLYAFTPDWKMIGWSVSACGILAIEQSSIAYARPLLSPKQTSWLKTWTWVQLIVFCCLIANPPTRSFDMVKVNSALGLVGIVLPLHLWMYLRRRVQGHRWVVAAVVLGMLPAITFNGKITLHTWFNFHDISHVLMACVMIVMYQGARRLALTAHNRTLTLRREG